MKTILCFIILIVTGNTLSAQQRYAYLPEGKTVFETSQEKIIFGFKKGFNKNNLLKRKLSALINDTSQFVQAENRKWNIFSLNSAKVNKDTLDSRLTELKRDTSILYANKFLIYKDGTLQGLTDQLVVRLKTSTGFNAANKLFKNLGVYDSKLSPYIDREYILTIDPAFPLDALDVANSLFESGLFEYAEPEFIKVGVFRTADPIYPSQWNLQNIGQYNGTVGADVRAYLSLCASTGSGARVAILDEGVDLNHPDLMANLLPGQDFLNLGSNGGPSGDDAHGTACAGIVAAVANNNLGVSGVAYTSRILPARIGQNESMSTTAAASAMNWAQALLPLGGAADVISCSWGGGSSSSTLNTAIANAIAYGRGGKGCVVIFSSGNDNSSSIAYPSNQPNVVAVGATNMCDQRSSLIPTPAPNTCNYDTRLHNYPISGGSNYGTGLGVVAPGINIATTDIAGAAGLGNHLDQGWFMSGNDYVLNFDGTSAACPLAAGVVALILSINPALTYTQAINILEATTDKVGGYSYSSNLINGTWNTEMGYGRINAANAATRALSTLGITGATYFCSGSSSYSVFTNSAITWSISGTAATLGCTSCNPTTLTKVSNGPVVLTASFANSCGLAPVTTSFRVNVGQNPLTLQSSMQGACNGTYQNWLLSENPSSGGSNWHWTVGQLGQNSHINITSPFSSSTNASVSGGGTVNITYTDLCGTAESDGVTIYSFCHSFAVSPNPANNLVNISVVNADKKETSSPSDNPVTESTTFAPIDGNSNANAGTADEKTTNKSVGTQQLTVATGEPSIKSVAIYDVNGKLIRSYKYNSEKRSIEINISDVVPGVYFVHIFDGKTIMTKKLLIHR